MIDDTKSDTDIAFLDDLAERLMHVPVMHGIDQADAERLDQIARRLKEVSPRPGCVTDLLDGLKCILLSRSTGEFSPATAAADIEVLREAMGWIEHAFLGVEVVAGERVPGRGPEAETPARGHAPDCAIAAALGRPTKRRCHTCGGKGDLPLGPLVPDHKFATTYHREPVQCPRCVDGWETLPAEPPAADLVEAPAAPGLAPRVRQLLEALVRLDAWEERGSHPGAPRDDAPIPGLEALAAEARALLAEYPPTRPRREHDPRPA